MTFIAASFEFSNFSYLVNSQYKNITQCSANSMNVRHAKR